MSPGTRPRANAAVIVLALCATVLAQSFALAMQDQQHHGLGHYCQLCHMGPPHLVQTTVTARIVPVFSVVWLACSEPVHDGPEIHVPARTSRAPPA